MTSDSTLAIDESKLIDSGTRRRVYLHPEDDDKLLKIFWEDQLPARRRAQCWYGVFKSSLRFDDNENDFRQYRRAMNRASRRLGSIYRIYGYAETTEGRALVVDRVRNADGETSVTLASYLRAHGPLGIPRLVEELFEELAANHVVVKDPHAENIVVQELEGGRLKLVVIDGYGDNNFIPFASMSQKLNRQKLMRKKRSLLRRLGNYAKNP